MSDSLKLRPASVADDEFLCELYRTTRQDEVAAFGWDEAQQSAFLKMQFSMQQKAYAMQYPAAVTSVILFGDERAGRTIVDRTEAHISLIDIAVLPKYRKHGIATRFINDLQTEAAAAARTVTLQVDKANASAMKLYKDLGFVVSGESQFHFLMEWRAPMT